MPDRFSLPTDTIDILGERLNLDVRVFPFEIPHVARTIADRSRIADATMSELERHGLAYRGRPEPDVEDALVMLARWPGLAMTQALRTGGELVARVASNGRAAVLAVQRTGSIDFELLRPAAVLAAVLCLIPRLKPFPGRSVTFPRDEPVARQQGSGVLQPVRQPLSGYEAQREIARRMMAHPCRAGGMVVGFGRDHHRGEPLVWRDTDTGRFSTHVAVGRDGNTWCAYTPADTDRLALQIGEIWQSITANLR